MSNTNTPPSKKVAKKVAEFMQKAIYDKLVELNNKALKSSIIRLVHEPVLVKSLHLFRYWLIDCLFNEIKYCGSNRSISVLSSTSLLLFPVDTYLIVVYSSYRTYVCFCEIEQNSRDTSEGLPNCCYFIRIYAPSSIKFWKKYLFLYLRFICYRN